MWGCERNEGRGEEARGEEGRCSGLMRTVRVSFELCETGSKQTGEKGKKKTHFVGNEILMIGGKNQAKPEILGLFRNGRTCDAISFICKMWWWVQS